MKTHLRMKDSCYIHNSAKYNLNELALALLETTETNSKINVEAEVCNF